MKTEVKENLQINLNPIEYMIANLKRENNSHISYIERVEDEISNGRVEIEKFKKFISTNEEIINKLQS